MLKKAGIVVATAAAGMLALSPLAFAGGMSGDSWGPSSSEHHGDKDHGDKGDTTTLVSQDGNGGNSICETAQSNVSGDAAPSGNALLGLLPILNGNSASALNNANVLDCANILNNNLNDNNVQVAVLGATGGGQSTGGQE